jgi:hypothetical protein
MGPLLYMCVGVYLYAGEARPPHSRWGMIDQVVKVSGSALEHKLLTTRHGRCASGTCGHGRTSVFDYAQLRVFVLGTALGLGVTHKLRIIMALLLPCEDTQRRLEAFADVPCDVELVRLCCPVALEVVLVANDAWDRAWWAARLSCGPSLARALGSGLKWWARLIMAMAMRIAGGRKATLSVRRDVNGGADLGGKGEGGRDSTAKGMQGSVAEQLQDGIRGWTGSND